MDTYQPIYDAVRSRIGNGDIGSAVESAIRDCGLSHYANMAFESARGALSEYERPSVLFRPSLSIDGNQWCALYGDNLQNGLAGFGDSPDTAMRAFDMEWLKKIQPSPLGD